MTTPAAQSGESDQTVLQVLESDHASLLRLLDQLSGPVPTGQPDPERPAADDLREQLVIEAVRHFVAEEQYLLPLVRDRLDGGDALADSAFAGSRECEQALRGLERSDDSDAAVLERISRLMGEHIASQREKLFPALAERVPADELRRLGAQVRGAEQVASTRPRAVAPANPALNKVSSLVEGFLDHVRDSYTRRGAEENHIG